MSFEYDFLILIILKIALNFSVENVSTELYHVLEEGPCWHRRCWDFGSQVCRDPSSEWFSSNYIGGQR